MWGSELRSSGLCSEHFPNQAISLTCCFLNCNVVYITYTYVHTYVLITNLKQNYSTYFRWIYTCIDLLDFLQTKYAGTNFSLQRISLQKSSEFQSIYVDAVYIGQTPTVSALGGMFFHFIIVHHSKSSF